MAARTTERGRVIPVRDPEREKAAEGPGPVKSYMMSPEELEDYRARTGYKEPRNQVGEKINQPVQQGSVRTRMQAAEEQSRRDKMSKPTAGPVKQVFLQMVADGKSIAAAERELGLKQNGMYYWLKKWDLIGINPGKAQELLKETGETMAEEPIKESTEPVAQEATLLREKDVLDDRDRKISDLMMQIKVLELDRDEHRKRAEKLEKQNAYAVALSGEASDKQQAEIEQLTADKAELLRYLETAKQELQELIGERDLLLQTVERAIEQSRSLQTVSGPANDPVNHPSHYTAGSVECIDAIEAATIGLSGGQAYATGAALKYLWRWSRKNGAEDLHKARWYVDRLIALVEQESREIGELEGTG